MDAGVSTLDLSCGCGLPQPWLTELYPWVTRSLAQMHRRLVFTGWALTVVGRTVLLGLARELGTEKGWVHRGWGALWSRSKWCQPPVDLPPGR